jgi:hypothetical protein
MKRSYLKILVSGTYLFFIVLVLMHAFITFDIHFPIAKGESYDEGLEQVVHYVVQHQNQYKEIVFDTRHGVNGPYLISNPYLYLIFYSRYDPATYQTEPKTYDSPEAGGYHFDKYTFKYINWSLDSKDTDTLFIGSPWSFPSDLGGVKILDTIKLAGGQIAYYIVVPTKP